ncbi:MAG: fasciclin domain-containing protein [Chloroflexota bacterium]
MKSLWKILALLIMASVAIVGVQAQEEDTDEATTNIVDLASQTDDLSTLVAAVQAADPAILETLSDEDGTFTVFAPTNQAFENLIATLGIDAETLLADDSLTTILQYHVVAGEVLSDALAEQDGGFVETILPDNFIGVSIADDGTVVLNDVVTVTTADIDASNGVVHLIDDVLLPQSALEAFGLVEADNTNLQVLHFSPDAPNVDVYVDGDIAIENLAFGANSGYVTLPSGDYEIAVAPAGTSVDDVVIGPVTVTLNAGDFLNIAAIGSVEAGTLTVTSFTQDFGLLEDDQFGLSVLHAVEGAPAVDVVLNGEAVIEELAYPFTNGTNDGAFNQIGILPVDSLTVDVTDGGATLLDLSSTDIQAGTYYLVVVGGTADAPQAYVYPTTPERANTLNDALFGSGEEDAETTPEPEMTEEPMNNGSIADIVIASTTTEEPEFTILLQAVQNADPIILETLQGTDPVTVFAPTDEAFSNLLSITGLSAEELLASDLLTDILLYHVTSGEVDGATVREADGELVPTLLSDAFIGISYDDENNLRLNEVVGLVATDIQANNGIIHVIDEVLLPQSALDAFGFE